MIKNFNKLVLVVADLDNRNPIFFLFISIFRYTKLKNMFSHVCMLTIWHKMKSEINKSNYTSPYNLGVPHRPTTPLG